MNCAALGGYCGGKAKWKVPMYGEPGPHCLCDEHVKGWRENQPENVKAIDDDTPWPSGRPSIVKRAENRPASHE